MTVSPPRSLLAGLALLCACADPALVPYRDAARAFDDGRKALDDGDNASAIAAFSTARTLDAHSPVLPLWQARAFAASGDLEKAIQAADDALKLDPGSAIAHYNRAAWLARGGRVEDAAPDLKAALDLGAATPWNAAKDPDFAPHRRDPAFTGILPAEDLTATLVGPSGSSFLGSEVELEFVLDGPTDAIPTLTGPAIPGCLRQSRIIEDDEVPAPGSTRRTLQVRFRASAVCTVSLGPFEARNGDATVALAPVLITVLGPEGALPDAAPAHPAAWILPGGLSGESAVPGWPVAHATMGERRPDPAVLLEWRVAHQTRAIGGIWVSP